MRWRISSGGVVMIDWYARLEIPDEMEVARDGRASIMAYRSLPPGFAGYLANVRFGTAGVQYRRLDVAAELRRLDTPIFFAVWIDGSIAGTYVLNLRTLAVDGESILGAYRALLSVAPEHSAQGLGRWVADRCLEWFRQRCVESRQVALSWGCIEVENERSLKALAAAGGEELGRLESLLTYRQWPRKKLVTNEPTLEQQEDLRALVDAALTDCAVRPMPLFDQSYRVASLPNGHLAGARVVSERVSMERIGGIWDSLYRYLLRYSGAARRRFDPSNFHYLRISDLAISDESVVGLPDFVTSNMAEEGSHMAMFVVDQRSRLAARLRDLGLFGRFAAATRTEIVVMGRMLHGDKDLVGAVRRAPIALTPLTG